MTPTDRTTPHPGYWPSPWPVECGGNRRQKAGTGRLDAVSGTATVRSRRNDRWNVMIVRRDPGAWYLAGTMAAFTGPPPFGWVDRIDAETLESVAASEPLPCGDHVWCGAVLAHANGSIICVNGSFVHRLAADDLSVLAECRFPVDRSHNGLLALADGTLITKDLRLDGQGGTTLINGGLAGIDTSENELTVRWTLDVRPSMQPVVFPESGELVINDFTDAGEDDLVVADVLSGRLIDRVRTGSRIGNGMFLTAGDDRDVFYCTTSSFARVRWS